MSSSKIFTPPRLAEFLLRIFHKDRNRYTHLGDFAEVFHSIGQAKGRSYATLWYWAQVLKSIPGFFTNKLYWSIAMFKNYIIITLRNIRKNKTFSIINILGLAVGMACFILILSYVQHEWNFDRFHEKTDRIYRLLSQDTAEAEEKSMQEYSDNFPEVLGPILASDFPEIEHASLYMRSWGDQVVLQHEDRHFYQSGIFTDPAFLQIFTYPLLLGEKTSALQAPNSIIITESVAHKLFGDIDPLGKPISYKERFGQYELIVSGVIEDVPANSHLQFDYLISIETLKTKKSNSFMFNNWNVSNFHIYLGLTGPESKPDLEEKLRTFAGGRGVQNMEFKLQPVKDIHLRSSIEGELETNNEVRYVYLFTSIAFIILLVACINAMNLATARSSTRAREIGIRKVTGANRRQLFQQFIGESMFMAFLAMILALALIKFMLPVFSRLMGIELAVDYAKNPTLLLLILITTLFVGLFSGAYPALVLSTLQPVLSLRDYKVSGKKGRRLRNFLVIAQFSASIILIISTLIVFGQMDYIKSKKIGYDREQVVVIPIRERETLAQRDVIKTAFLQHPQVLGISLSGALPNNIRSRMINSKFTKDDGETVLMGYNFDYVDEHFLDIFKIELAQGRNFSLEFGEDKGNVIVNESLVNALGWSEPIGKDFPFMHMDKKPRVVGVVKDFYFATLHHAIGPMALSFEAGSNICVRIRPGDIPATLGLLRESFAANTKGQPFDYFFLDDAFNTQYQKEMRTGEMFGYFAGLTVFIACLGLFGLAAFTVERRTKEIGIRKVMGANIPSLTTLLSKDFAVLVLLANLIAWPVAYYAMNRWLQNFTYRIGINPLLFLLATGGTLTLAFITISLQTIKAAATDPVDTLRYE